LGIAGRGRELPRVCALRRRIRLDSAGVWGILRAMRIPASLFAFALAGACAAVSACGSSSSSGGAPSAKLDDGLPASCSPIRTSGACMLPWPNAIYLSADPSTKTGFRMALTPETLPMKQGTVAFDPTRVNMGDGFSPAGPIVALFPEHIDPASLVSPSDPSPSKTPSAATAIVDMDTGALVPHFSEVDLTIRVDQDRQAVMIRPLARLLPAHRYAVAFTTAVKTTDGKLPTPPPQFAAIADGHAPADAMSQKQAARMPDILAALAKAGITRDKLVVAWDFVTASDDFVTSHLLSMRDQGLADIGASGGAFTITKTMDNPSALTARIILGTFTVPQFISPADSTNPKAEISFDAKGLPVMQGHYEAPFAVIIPAVAATKGPLPTVLFGHGLLGTAEGALSVGQVTEKFANDKGYVLFATDWIGLSAHEDPLLSPTNGAIGEALADMNHMPWVTDRLQQALLNAMVLVRTFRGKMATDASMAIGGKAVADVTKPTTYWGISNGGIMGAAFMGYDPDVTLAVLGVPGGFWSTMFQRSSQWPQFHLILGGAYSDYADQQLMLAVAQSYIDFADPATAAPHLVGASLTGVPKKQIIAQMSVGDSQVPNLATEAMARTEGISLVGQSPISLFGIAQTDGPAASGMTVWDVHPNDPAPLTNETPPTDNGAHGAIHWIPALQDQIDHFFQHAEVINTCNGLCSFTMPTH
jgi:hypothetical protein